MGQITNYQIKAIYDTETSNITGLGGGIAYPILYQLGYIKENIFDITKDNVKSNIDIHLFRNYLHLKNEFISLYNEAEKSNTCYIILVHNLGFDLWSIGDFLLEFAKTHNIEVVAKSCQKPITVTIMSDKDPKIPVLRFWDTLTFTGKSLETLGKECNMPKLMGAWNYELLRTPATPLTENEIAYAKEDIYTLAVYMSYWAKMNPNIDTDTLGVKILTKTGVVRQHRLSILGDLKSGKHSVKQNWYLLNEQNKPKTNKELFIMHAATRGGFTFTANKYASKAYSLNGTNYKVIGFDAASQHPAQIISHLYPVDFKEATSDILNDAFNRVISCSEEKLLQNWKKPFNSAFYGNFIFKNLRPKKGSAYEKHGIYPLASDRFLQIKLAPDSDNLTSEFTNYISDLGYKDSAKNLKYAFGKVISSDIANIYLTELEAWIISRCYTWDSMSAISGYITSKFVRPPDLTVLSVIMYYKRKNIFKKIMEQYKRNEDIHSNDDLSFIPKYLLEGMKNHDSDIEQDMNTFYLSLKGDLNALYGIEITNEYRPNIILSKNGLEVSKFKGLENAPKKNKTFYQFGQRIVGWSRIAQCLHIELANIYAAEIITGDTDSLKMYIQEKNIQLLVDKYAIYYKYLTIAKNTVCKRVKLNFPEYFSDLNGIGGYELEFETKYFCAAWNKAYISFDGKNNWKITLAGMPCHYKLYDNNSNTYIDTSLCNFANLLYNQYNSFEKLSGLLLGYNVTYGSNITGNSVHYIPKFGNLRIWQETDYLGKTIKFMAPQVVCISGMHKEIGGTHNHANKINYEIAKLHNKYLNHLPIMINYYNGKYNIDKLA